MLPFRFLNNPVWWLNRIFSIELLGQVTNQSPPSLNPSFFLAMFNSYGYNQGGLIITLVVV